MTLRNYAPIVLGVIMICVLVAAYAVQGKKSSAVPAAKIATPSIPLRVYDLPNVNFYGNLRLLEFEHGGSVHRVLFYERNSGGVSMIEVRP